MQLQNDTYSSNTVAGGPGVPNETASTGNNELPENKNLSDIISRIQDEGPVALRSKVDGKRKAQSIKQQLARKRHNNLSDKREGPIKQTTQSTNRGKVMLENSDQEKVANEIPRQHILDYYDNQHVTEDLSTNNRKETQWQQVALLFMFAVIIVMGFFIYQIKGQTQVMMSSIDEYNDYMPVIDDVHRKSTDALQKVTSLKKNIVGLEKELDVMEEEFGEFDKIFTMSRIEEHESQIKELVAVRQEVNELQDIIAKASEIVTETKVEPEVITSSIAIPVDELVVTVNEMPTKSWAVNLVSLSSLDLAIRNAEKLEQIGMKPMIEEAVINGATVFRLSVDGFTSIREANVFVDEVREKYGYQDAWIRRG